MCRSEITTRTHTLVVTEPLNNSRQLVCERILRKEDYLIWKGLVRKGKERIGKERKGKERKGKGREGKGREGKGRERKGKAWRPNRPKFRRGYPILNPGRSKLIFRDK